MITGETLIKGLFYFLLKGKEGGKYLSRKRVTGKTGKQRWVYDYGKKGKKEKAVKEPKKKHEIGTIKDLMKMYNANSPQGVISPKNRILADIDTGYYSQLLDDVEYGKKSIQDVRDVVNDLEKYGLNNTGQHPINSVIIPRLDRIQANKKKKEIDPNEEIANIQMDRNELHRDFSSVKNYLENNRFASRDYRLERDLETQLAKVRELSQNIKDKRSHTNLKKQFSKLQELSKQYSDLKTKHEERLEQEKKEAEEKEAQKQANKGELDKVAKVEYDKLLQTPKILNPMLKVIKARKMDDAMGVIHVKPDGYYATDGRILVYNKANTGVSENRTITTKGQSGDPDVMKTMDDSMPNVIQMGINHAKIPVKLDVKKLQAKLKESKAPYVIMKLGDSEVQLKKDLLNKILDAAKGWNKPVVLSHDDSSNNPLMLHIEGKPGADSFGLIMPMRYDDMWTQDDKNQYQDLTGFLNE